ncbi:GntR family transcriptional regulator [Roseovarius sp.]|uniref:GntR family transcriptional regulator n=1 Tax=Roseovarius sp. TaxID=1486281 RepID=UPI00262D4EA9|nr:GntR family transcriptional regulator [Roseovarius sp.]MDM8165774.1 GntR family transcriptional regulator [Roseovarius sp.]
MDILRNSPGKLYLHVADILRQRLRSGALAPGDRLKPISELAEEFRVATVTIRQAVAILESEGRLYRQQGAGTFVTENSTGDDSFAVGLDWPELLDMVTKTDPRLIEKRENVELPSRGDLKGGKAASSYVYLRRVNALKGLDCLVADAYIASDLYEQCPERFDHETIIPVIESLPGVTIAKCHQTLTIGQADMDKAGLLGLPLSAPLGDIRRILTAPDGTVLYYNDVSYRGDMVKFEISLELSADEANASPARE